jgi:hypothetical protein
MPEVVNDDPPPDALVGSIKLTFAPEIVMARIKKIKYKNSLL